MKLAATIERLKHPRCYLIVAPAMNGKPYRDPDQPNVLICPLTARGGWTRTRLGAWLMARRFQRLNAKEKN